MRDQVDQDLAKKGFVSGEKDLGFERTKYIINRSSSNRWYENSDAYFLTTAAGIVGDKNASDLVSFTNNAECLERKPNPITCRPKYRSINGYGNNLQEPFAGSAGAPFRRFAPKNFYDGAYSPRRSVAINTNPKMSYLPNPRKVVQNVLFKAEKTKRTCNEPSDFLNIMLFHIMKDISQQSPRVSTSGEIRCCSKGNSKILPKPFRNSACLPLAIDPNDSFYKDAGIGCLNFIRSELSSLPSSAQYGEIKNTVTAYIDLSILYGSEESDTNAIRTFSNGKLNMDAKNLLPVDCNGKYTKASEQLLTVPTTVVLPALFARNHNKLAEELAKLNCNWNDSTIFEEARRINIAINQHIAYDDKLVELISGHKIDNAACDEKVDPSAVLEFNTACYRHIHSNINPNVKLVSDCGTVTNIPLSDSFGKINIAEDKFDDVLRGLTQQQLNIGELSDELLNKFAKNENGVGVDIFSLNILRGESSFKKVMEPSTYQNFVHRS